MEREGGNRCGGEEGGEGGGGGGGGGGEEEGRSRRVIIRGESDQVTLEFMWCGGRSCLMNCIWTMTRSWQRLMSTTTSLPLKLW